jgi:hypothetical protein
MRAQEQRRDTSRGDLRSHCILWLCAGAIGFTVASVGACGAETTDATVAGLDSTDEHHGKTYAQWAAEWVLYSYRFAPPECRNPLEDPTGAWCRENQDPESPVFFLAGGHGGVFERDECVVPAGKALFFPLINMWSDNAGVTEGMTATLKRHRQFVEDGFALMDATHIWLRVDGRDVGNLQHGAVPIASYVLDLPPPPNRYSCVELDDFEGEFPGYVSGYWAMLPPLEPGAHTIEFGGKSGVFADEPDFQLDVRYDLIVE